MHDLILLPKGTDAWIEPHRNLYNVMASYSGTPVHVGTHKKRLTAALQVSEVRMGKVYIQHQRYGLPIEHPRRSSRVSEETKLSLAKSITEYLKEHGTADSKILCQHLNQNSGTLTSALNSMMRKGLVQRKIGPDNSRFTYALQGSFVESPNFSDTIIQTLKDMRGNSASKRMIYARINYAIPWYADRLLEELREDGILEIDPHRDGRRYRYVHI